MSAKPRQRGASPLAQTSPRHKTIASVFTLSPHCALRGISPLALWIFSILDSTQGAHHACRPVKIQIAAVRE